MPAGFAARLAGFPDTGPLAADRFEGTVWEGRMQIDGRHDLTWSLQSARSLWSFGFAADWHLAGPGTDLSGEVVLRPGGIDLGPFSGVAGWPLVAAAMPGLPISCTGAAKFAAVKVVVDGAVRSGAGTATTPEGECARIDGGTGPVPTPALHAQIGTEDDAITVLVTPQDGPRVALVTARLTAADRVVVTINRAGAALVPGMPSTQDSELDLPLSILLGR